MAPNSEAVLAASGQENDQLDFKLKILIS
ncbi:uncharacterized protein G2W53_030701 [Senna tora]|uniref:Uncharacterized protein n=1 Tax=Senna tora TaxID=362788 RepID=A0A834T7H7_9FABA|nr:uncharacterized protein G2W53_030701 [Senna tora]